MNLQFGKAFRILWESFPFVLLRLAVYALALVLAVAWWGGIAWLFFNWPFPGPAWLAWVFGGVLFGTAAKLIRRYVVYLVRAAHIGVITRLAVDGDIPKGTTQFGYGGGVVFDNIVRVSLLFGVDRLVAAVLKAFNKSMFKLVGGVIPGVKMGEGFVKQLLDYSVGYVDEAILSYSLLYPDRSPWATARDALVLYVQNWKTILGSGMILAAGSYLVVGLVAAPAALAAWLLGGAFKPALIGGAVGLGFLIKFALVDPFALTAVIVNFHAAIEGQRPDPEWDAKLAEVSDKYVLIREQAGGLEGAGGAVPPPPPPAADPAT